MCGISVIVALQGQTHQVQQSVKGPLPEGVDHAGTTNPKDAEAIKLSKELDESLDRIEHRGPDSRGQWISGDKRVALGHVRLSINDLSPSGAQPFHSPDGDIHAVVNGELYDHDRIRAELIEKTGYKFKSSSDCEIVIALYKHYGMSFLSELRGEFALCLYDEKRKFFVAARDRYGIKPLFWTVADGRLLIAAEAKAFLPLGWKPEWDVRSIVEGGWNHDERTLFRGVQKVRPGHYLTCSSFGHVESRQYWDIDFPHKDTQEPRTSEEMIAGVQQQMLESIRLRLRADVPVGVYLSGGIDSSVIAGMVSHLVREQNTALGSSPASERVNCFSIAFDGGSGYDESSIAQRTADWLGVNFYKKLMDETALADRFEEATWHTEHHYPDLNYVGKFALSEIPREKSVKAVLTGEGADEIFGGYPAFLPDYLRESDKSWPHSGLADAERQRQLGLAEKTAEDHYRTIGADISHITSTEASTAVRQLCNLSTPASMTAFNPLSTLFAPWVFSTYGSSLNPLDTIANNIDGRVKDLMKSRWHPLHSALYIWSKGHLGNIFLSCLGDRTEMAHSLEARTPLLDHKLTEYVAKIPPSLKVKWVPSTEKEEGHFVEKSILREASKPFITSELYERKKHPYSAPTTWPTDGPLHKLMKRLVTKDRVEALGFVSWDNVSGVVDDAFGAAKEEETVAKQASALRTCIVLAQWVTIGEKFDIQKAGPF